MKVLDVGCGWGSFCKYAAGKYNMEVVGINVSKEQADLGMGLCKGLNVDIKLQDYRNLPYERNFDRIVSVGMFEHVGYKNYKVFMKTIHRLLKDNGLIWKYN